MLRLGKIQDSVRANFAEQFMQGFRLGQDMLNAIPCSLDSWKREHGVHVVGAVVGHGVHIHTCRQADFSRCGFVSLEQAAVSLSLLREAWRPYVDIIEISRWEGDEEITLKVAHAFPA